MRLLPLAAHRSNRRRTVRINRRLLFSTCERPFNTVLLCTALTPHCAPVRSMSISISLLSFAPGRSVVRSTFQQPSLHAAQHIAERTTRRPLRHLVDISNMLTPQFYCVLPFRCLGRRKAASPSLTPRYKAPERLRYLKAKQSRTR